MSRGSLWSSTSSLDVGWAPAIIGEEEKGMGRRGKKRRRRKREEKKKDTSECTYMHKLFTNYTPCTLCETEVV